MIMKATALASLLAAAHALDCESDNSPFAESRFVDDKGTTCAPGKYLCGDTSEHAYCFGDYKEKMADWKHPSHYPFEWVADQDDSEVNVDGNCILCTRPDAAPKLDDMDARKGIVEQEVQTEKKAAEAKAPAHDMEKDMREREERKAAREASASSASEQKAREDAQKEADDFSVREAARKVAEADLKAEKAAKVADQKANAEADERKAYAKAAKEVQRADKAEATETVIGADVNASHPYKDGTYNDLNVDESPQQVAERKHAEKALAWKIEQEDLADDAKAEAEDAEKAAAEEKAAKIEQEDLADDAKAEAVHEEKATAWRAEKEAAQQEAAAAVHEEKAAAWRAEKDAAQEKKKAWRAEKDASQEAAAVASAEAKVERMVPTDAPSITEEATEAEAPATGPSSSARAERMAKKAAKKAKKSFYITNDPFFVVNGKKGHFWLPAGAPQKLLSVPFPDASHSVALLGETFGDGEASQWFKTYTLAVNGEHLVKVEVSDKPGELMRTMKVWTNGRELSAPRDAVHHVGYNVTVSANALPIKKIGSESAEEVVIRTPAVSFTIWTQQANKFDEVEKRVQYAHLNMEVDGGLPETAEGIAAEFAGVRTMSSETEALLEMPVAIAQERQQAKSMRKYIKANKRRLSSMSNIASLDAEGMPLALTPAQQQQQQQQQQGQQGLSSSNGLIQPGADGDVDYMGMDVDDDAGWRKTKTRHDRKLQRRLSKQMGRRSKRTNLMAGARPMGDRPMAGMTSRERKLAVQARKEARRGARNLDSNLAPASEAASEGPDSWV